MKDNFKNKKGFTIIEMVTVMFVIAVILASVLVAVRGVTDNSRTTNAVASIRSLQTASLNYYNTIGGGSYNNLSIAALAANNLLPNYFTSGTGANPWNGDITIAPDPNPDWFDITLTNVPAEAATNLTNAVSKFTQAQPNYSGETWSAIF